MKKVFTFIIMLCLLMSGCGLRSADPDPQDEPVLQNTCDISLGITPQQLLEQLSKMNWEIDMPDYGEFPLPEDIAGAVPDGRIYNMTDLSFYYKIKEYDLFFTFGYEGCLVSVTCWDERIATPEGLSVGDSLDQAKNIYGSGYRQNVDDGDVLQYTLNGEYLNIFYSENLVTGWNLNQYPNINND